MNELHALIASLEGQLADLRAHAAKDVVVVEADIAKAKAVVTAEIAALLAKLKHL
jgi:hypothetical protein